FTYKRNEYMFMRNILLGHVFTYFLALKNPPPASVAEQEVARGTDSNLMSFYNTYEKATVKNAIFRMYHILFHSLYSFYASSIKIYVAVTGPCTPTINFISISALLLGPVTKLTQLATSSPARLRSCIIFVACVIRGTIVLFGIRAT